MSLLCFFLYSGLSAVSRFTNNFIIPIISNSIHSVHIEKNIFKLLVTIVSPFHDPFIIIGLASYISITLAEDTHVSCAQY